MQTNPAIDQVSNASLSDQVFATAREGGHNGFPGQNYAGDGYSDSHVATSFIEFDCGRTELPPHIVGKDRRARAELALNETRKELRRLSGLLCTIQENERRRIALDLHDGLGQTLNLIKHSLENAARQASVTADADLIESLWQIVPRVNDAMGDVRRVAMELRPPMLDDLGILPTFTWFLREYESACSGLQVERVITVSEADVPESLKIVLFRILQEACNNILKHAGATRVWVRLERVQDELCLLVEDDGSGFDADQVVCSERTGRGLGLLSMKERADYSGGSFRLDSSPGQGTCIQVSWPIGPSLADQHADCALLRRCD